ncbi:MAG: penicillin-binding transpeptidase domain-containing protein [Actinomycetes bacterium]
MSKPLPPSDPTALRRKAAIGLTALALAAIVAAGLICGDDGGRGVAQSYAAAWARQDFRAMYSQLSKESKAKLSFTSFSSQQAEALATATVRRLTAREAGKVSDGVAQVPFTVETRAFGTLSLVARIPLTADNSDAHVVWSSSLLLPGLHRGESLSRSTSLPPRAALLASDGVALAEGPFRVSTIPEVASEVVGTVAAPLGGVGLTLKALGYPSDATVGITGLERIFQAQLAGTPGGTLSAGGRLLASTTPKEGKAVRTTIVPSVERAAITAMAGRQGGAAVIRPKTGEILALARSAFSEAAPPGSTFKIITAAAALDSKVTTLKTFYPAQTEAVLDGHSVQNANGESCGGTLVQSFAYSCNSVFAPLGVKVGAARLVEMAENLGFNRSLTNIPGASISRIPQASELQGADATGTSSIGQGQVVASALEMASVAATVANGGVRAEPTLTPVTRPTASKRAMSPEVTRAMRTLMLAVVRYGTGMSAAIPGVAIAGKTGTAEIRDTVPVDPNNPADPNNPEDPNAPAVIPNDPANTDAWFVAFAPAWQPRLAVCVLLDGAGHGGDTAAPAARDILITALKTSR